MHTYRGYGGPWVENHWISHFCCGVSGRAARFGPFVPLFVQWTDLWLQNYHSRHSAYGGVLSVLESVLRPDVLYITVSQNDDGVSLAPGSPGGWPLERWPNLLVVSAGGVGHIPIPLIKSDMRPVELASEEAARAGSRVIVAASSSTISSAATAATAVSASPSSSSSSEHEAKVALTYWGGTTSTHPVRYNGY